MPHETSTLLRRLNNGEQYLTGPTEGVTVGTAAGVPPANFTIRGSQVQTPIVEQFHSIGFYNAGATTEMETHWRMFRLQGDGNPRSIGHIWAANSVNPTNLNFDFNVQATVVGASLWLRNRNNNGIRILDDANNQPNFVTGACTNTGWRFGYGAIGVESRLWAHNAPWSRWTLVHHAGTTNTAAFRSFMRNGVTMIGNQDLMYVGQLINMSGTTEQSDQTDAAVVWYDNNLATGNVYDNCTFRFLSDACQANAGPANTATGLEIMRLRPFRANATDPIQGFVGIGDWVTAAVQPDERLHLLNRTIRIQRLIPDYNNNSLNNVVVADASGRLHWRDANTLGGADCDWTIATTGGVNHVSTAYGATVADCPDDGEAVGIGVDLDGTTPTAKANVVTDNFETGLDVDATMVTANSTGVSITASGGTTGTRGIDILATQSTGNAQNRGISISAVGGCTGTALGCTNYGIRVDLTGTAYRTRGFSAATTGGGITAYGGEFLAYDAATDALGVIGRSYGGVVHSIGVEGEAFGDADVNIGVAGRCAIVGDANTYIGVRGQAPVNENEPKNSIAVWSEGDQFSSTSTAWYPSDELLKVNIEELSGDVALQHVLQLHPKTYSYNTAQYGFMNLPMEPQIGLLAQEVEAVMPALVTDMRRPADIDSLGNVLNPEVHFKAMKNDGLIPTLIAAMQEQNATITALQEQLTQLQAQVNGCCGDGSGMQQQPGGPMNGGSLSVSDLILGNERALTIQPNPFNERTTLYYTLERNGRMQLMANSADGKQLRVLHEANMEAGQYQHEWQTSELSPGIYYVTLLLDGEPIVKKAVKVQR